MNRRDLLKNAAWLTGGAIAAPAAITLLHSCGTDEARRSFTPEYFSREEAEFVSSYVDTLLPRTETPGGLDVGVDIFIDKFMAIVAPKTDEPSDMSKGILEMNEEAVRTYQRGFADLDETQRGALFAAAEERSPRYNPQVWGTTIGEQPPVGFYRSFKSMALWAYLSSKTIATEVLNYDPIPGEYDGDIALSSVGGKAWSL